MPDLGRNPTLDDTVAVHTPPGSAAGVRAVARALGLAVGVSGLDHGFFEALQGPVPTSGFVVQAIGPAQRMWSYGTEEAFTVVPNFLATGLLAMVLGLLAIVWSLRFLDRPRGSLVLLLIGGLLFLVGGGVAMLVPLVAGWAVARRIQRPPHAPRILRSTRVAGGLSRAWPALIVASLALYAFALEIAIVGFVPGVADPDQRLAICWADLLLMLGALLAALLGASVAASESGIARSAAALPVSRPR